MGTPPNKLLQTIPIMVTQTPINIAVFDANCAKENLQQQAVNIFASGPSIAQVDFISSLVTMPSIFVNGSISLAAQHSFTQIVGYVISDARFIKHNPEILRTYYTGQPLYATMAVFEAMAKSLPELISNYHCAMRVIYPVDRPIAVSKDQPLLNLNQLPIIKKWLTKKKSLVEFSHHPNFVIDTAQHPSPIGVSLDITDGFVEAGTVAYVATQLAFARQASAIHLYGIDLLNSEQPRFYEDTDNRAPCKLDKAISERIVPSFELLGRVYKQHGVPVINHSPISKALFKELEVEV